MRRYLAVDQTRLYQLLNARQYEAAETMARELLALDPNNSRLHYYLAVALHSLEKHDTALAAIDKSLSLGHESGSQWSLRGYCLLGLGRAKEAVKAFDSAISQDPLHAGHLLGRGRSQIALADQWIRTCGYPKVARREPRSLRRHTEQAASDLKAAVGLQPENPAIHIAMSRLAGVRRRPADALVHAQEALRLAPASSEAILALANAETLNGKHASASKLIMQAGRADPSVSGQAASALQQVGRRRAVAPLILTLVAVQILRVAAMDGGRSIAIAAGGIVWAIALYFLLRRLRMLWLRGGLPAEAQRAIESSETGPIRFFEAPVVLTAMTVLGAGGVFAVGQLREADPSGAVALSSVEDPDSLTGLVLTFGLVEESERAGYDSATSAVKSTYSNVEFRAYDEFSESELPRFHEETELAAATLIRELVRRKQPFTVLVGSNGHIRSVEDGLMSGSELRSSIALHLQY